MCSLELPDQMLKSQIRCVPLKCSFPSVYKDMCCIFYMALKNYWEFLSRKLLQIKKKIKMCNPLQFFVLISHTSESQRA